MRENPKFGIREQVELTAKLSLAFVALGLFQFPSAIRRQVRQEQGFCCADCGKRGFLQTHHRVPENAYEGSLGIKGKNVRDNAVGLCPQDHVKWDRLALEENIIYPGVPLSEVPRKLYRVVKK